MKKYNLEHYALVTLKQNRRQKVFNRGLYVCAGALDILKIDKTPLIYSVSYFNLGRLGAPFGVISPPTPHPVARVMQVRHH